MNPWENEAPDCPVCDIKIRMFLWDFDDPDKWFCARCHRLFYITRKEQT